MTEQANVNQGDLENKNKGGEPSSGSEKNMQQALKRVIGQRDKTREKLELESDVNQDLLTKNQALAREIEILRKSTGVNEDQPIGEKPTLEGCENDPVKLEAQLDRYYSAKALKDQADRQKAEQSNQEFDSSVNNHYERAEKLEVPDYEQAEVSALSILGSQIVEGITLKINNSEQLLYMLGNDTKEALRLKTLFERDPAAATIELGRLSAVAVSYKNESVASPEAGLNSGGKPNGEVERLERELDVAYDDASKTGKLTEVKRIKALLKEAAKSE